MIDLSNIPRNPGCYLFKNKSGNIIYIGKAKSLNSRVRSYFKKNSLDPKTKALVKNIDSVDFVITDNEVEALILENNLIKKHTPRYNIDLKDSKRYACINITNEDFPRLILARRRTNDEKSFGPFVSAAARDYVLFVLRKTFQLRTCKRMPKRPCLRHHINLCEAPCIGKISKASYQKKIDSIKFILNGKTNELLKSMEAEMKNSSKKRNFEHALELKNQIESIKWLNERQKMERKKEYNEDIINFIIKDKKVYLILFNVYKGVLENKQEFSFDYNDDFLEEFIVQNYSENQIPKEIILPKNVDDAVKSFLSAKAKEKIRVTVPKKGDKKDLLSLVLKNIELSFFGDMTKIEDLKKKLKLEENPIVIECFDISHLSGTSVVGSMVQFRNAKPYKNNYRRFKIRTVEGIDDTKAIAEVVRRRYSRLISEKSEFPNLIIIDGGKGQLNAATEELNILNLKIPTISIAKQYEEIYVPGLSFPLRLDKKSKGLKIIQEIRDEAHRFAIKYNRLLRKKELIK